MQRREFIVALGLNGACLALGMSRVVSGQASTPSVASLPDLIRTGISIRLTPIDVATDRNTVIWADQVTITEAVRTWGYGLTIVAREIIFGKDGSIDTRGREASPTYPDDARAADGRSAGENGQDGGNGGAGATAGNVLLVADAIFGEIVITASGGMGGSAQHGGNGAKGIRGAPQSRACMKGNQGSKGGAGGLAGTPGSGGSGGQVKLYAQQVVDKHPDINVVEGVPGAMAKHGLPGSGGDGGPGGSESWEYDEPRGRF